MKVRLLLLALLWPALASAEIFKWTDAKGKLHFSQNPPPGEKKFEKVEPPPPPLPPSQNILDIHRAAVESQKPPEPASEKVVDNNTPRQVR